MLRHAIRASRVAGKILEIWERDGFWAMQSRALDKARRKFAAPSAAPPAPEPPRTVDTIVIDAHPVYHIHDRDRLREWFDNFRPSASLLKEFRNAEWPAEAPIISVLMPVYNVRAEWLTEAVESVLNQTYPKWELICIDDGSPASHIQPLLAELAKRDPRMRVIHQPNRGVSAATNAGIHAATGRYVTFLDHDDFLEPHALHRFAVAILSDAPDMLYADEAVTGATLDEIRSLAVRCRFSHDYYLSYPYFVHPVVVKTEVARRAGGLDESLKVSQDVDFVLRVIENCRTISHVVDVLYRWRTHEGSLGHERIHEVGEATSAAITRHLGRLGVPADVKANKVEFNFYDVRYRYDAPAKVAVIIPTKNQWKFLKSCIESLERTVDSALADIVVVDHQSDEPESKRYLKEVARKHRVVPCQGPFNFSAIMNHGVAAVRDRGYSHYLFLNNDTQASQEGWLEHMLGFGGRPDVGIVGAMLLYSDDKIQHAGVTIGLFQRADHSHKFWPFMHNYLHRQSGQNGSLLSNREYSAVTAACMLMRADAFAKIGGFDETLAVGFNDTDLCLRARAAGFKVIQDAYAIVYHHESKTRGLNDFHEEDTKRFIDRYRSIVEGGDEFTSPLLSIWGYQDQLDPEAKSPRVAKTQTCAVELPPAVLPSRQRAAA